MVVIKDMITVTVNGPQESGKSAIVSLIAAALESKGVFIVNDGEFEHPVERAEKIVKDQLLVSVKLVENNS